MFCNYFSIFDIENKSSKMTRNGIFKNIPKNDIKGTWKI